MNDEILRINRQIIAMNLEKSDNKKQPRFIKKLTKINEDILIMHGKKPIRMYEAKMNKKIILLTINSKKTLYGLTANNYSAIQPNISMGLLSAYIKKQDIEVDMLDETKSYSIQDMIDIIVKERPILIGVICSGANPSSSTMSMVGAIEFFKAFNPVKNNIKTFICGGHPTVMYDRTLKETGVDFVVRGEGYQTIVNLYNVLNEGYDIKEMPRGDYNVWLEGLACIQSNDIVRVTAIPKLIDVNELPMNDWSLMDPKNYRAHNWHCFDSINERTPYAVIWTSFGCPYKCNFCCINNIFGKSSYRLRDIKTVIEEIDLLVTKYGVKNIKILDELFIIPNKRIDEFCDALEKRQYDLNIWAYGRMDTINSYLLGRLKKVGLNWMSMGMESVSKNVLIDTEKGCNVEFYDEVINMVKKEDVNICADFIAGLWLDDMDTMKETYDFAVKHNFEWLNIYPAFAYPGTKMYGTYTKEGRMEVPKSWEEYALYGYGCKPVCTKFISSEQVLKWRDDKFIEYHRRPEYLSMIETKFGSDTRKHILEMTEHTLKRKILE